MQSDREVRAIADQMMELIERLRRVEQVKQLDQMGSKAFVDHAIEAEDVASLVFRWSQLQLQMARASVAAVAAGTMTVGPIKEVEARPLDRILASWREAEMRLEIAEAGSLQAATATDDVERLRQEFQAAQSHQFARTAAPPSSPANGDGASGDGSEKTASDGLW